jgi:hypothetical protein
LENDPLLLILQHDILNGERGNDPLSGELGDDILLSSSGDDQDSQHNGVWTTQDFMDTAGFTVANVDVMARSRWHKARADQCFSLRERVAGAADAELHSCAPKCH